MSDSTHPSILDITLALSRLADRVADSDIPAIEPYVTFTLRRALRGLACAPHDPQLFYLSASACFELGAVEDALRLLYHTLWIHPGHRLARTDLEALTAFLDGSEDGEKAA